MAEITRKWALQDPAQSLLARTACLATKQWRRKAAATEPSAGCNKGGRRPPSAQALRPYTSALTERRNKGVHCGPGWTQA